MRLIETLIFLILLLYFSQSKAQEPTEKWTLDACINYALTNNINVKQSALTVDMYKENTLQSRANMFPSLSASASYSYVNYPSSEVDRQNTFTGNYGVNANWVIYQGGRRLASTKQSELGEKAGAEAESATAIDIKVSIVQSFLQVMYAQDAVEVNANTVEVSRSQRDRGSVMFSLGSIAKSDMAQLESQYSSDKYQLVVAQKALDGYLLSLKQSLELDVLQNIEIETIEIDDSVVMRLVGDKSTIYNTVLGVSPSLQSSSTDVEISELDVKIARSGYYPTLSMSAGIGAGHNSVSSDAINQQLKNSINENIGLTLSIPIYSRRENKSAVNKAKISVGQAQLQYQNTKKQLLQTVENLYLDAISSQGQYLAAKEQMKSAQESFNLVDAQYSNGMKNTVELLTEKSKLLQAQQALLQSKYMAVMNLMLLDIYQDKM